MATPGQSSGTYTFQLDNAGIVIEAFDRIQMRPASLDRHHFISARTSLNLELQRWSNLGINLFKMISGTINLIAGQATYALQTDLVTLTEVYYTTVNGNGSGYNNDRTLSPITRTQYSMIPNKLQPGQPTQYWFQRLATPEITLWQPPAVGAPSYVVNWYGLQRIQDAGLGSAETPDIVYRAIDALCAALAHRLAVKFSPPPVVQARKAEAMEAWDDFATNDQELGPLIVAPNLSGYGRMR